MRPEPDPNPDGNAETLPVTDPDGYEYTATLFDPISTNASGNGDYFTAHRNGRHIDAVTHHHPDGSKHDAIPDFTGGSGTFECLDCGAKYSVIVWRTADQR